jgi:NAD(P)-dependent dehydrogenase (short-subunit alcohol dehydrogenase family)
MDWDTLNEPKSAFNGVNNSKVFTVWHTYELNRRLSKFGVNAFCIHPGLVRTDVFRNSWLLGLVGSFAPSPSLSALRYQTNN